MENALENLLNSSVKKCKRPTSGGCISTALVYQTEDNKLLFVKQNSKNGVIIFFFFYSILYNKAKQEI